ncbi:MAG: DUF1559 domain-containing protein, partial [Aeoliella sp.]
VVKMNQVTDGTSNTLLVAEKYVNPWEYESATDPSDNTSLFQGNDFDRTRWTNSQPEILPLQDTPGVDSPSFRFGSAHPGAMNACFVDGSVRLVRYDIDPIAYESFGSRNGEELGNVP